MGKFQTGARLVKDSFRARVLKDNIPFYFTFAITYRCNSRCLTCNIWKVKKHQKELAAQEVNDIFSGSKYLSKVRNFSITGGEPFLRKDISDLVLSIKEKCEESHISISTNGSMPRKIRDEVGKMIDRFNRQDITVFVSVDAIGKKHDENRGVKGSFKKAMKTVELLKSINCRTTLNSTISPNNVREIQDVYELSKKLNCGFATRLAANSSFYYKNKDEKYEYSNEDMIFLEDFLKKVIRENRALFRSRDFFLSKFSSFQRNGDSGIPCYSSRFSFFLDPYGDVYPCISLDRVVGNLRKKPFDEVWKSKEMDDVRDFIKKRKCMCLQDCEMIPSIELELIPCLLWSIRNL